MSEKPTVYLPFRGEFGHRVMWHSRQVYTGQEARKIACIEAGTEALYPGCEYEHVPSPPDVKRDHLLKTDKEFRQKIQQQMAQKYPGATFVEPDRHAELTHFEPAPHIPQTDLSPDLVVCPRWREHGRDRNWAHWRRLTESLVKHKFLVVAAGNRDCSMAVPCKRAWEFDRPLDATIEVMRRAPLVVATDSGLAHLAVMLGRPTLIITFRNRPGPKATWRVKWHRYRTGHPRAPRLLHSIDNSWGNVEPVFKRVRSLYEELKDEPVAASG